MTDSILNSVKKMLGITKEYKHFDTDVIIHINSTFSILAQIGIGPDEGFTIEDESTTWSEFIPEDSYHLLDMVRTYMFMRVRSMFDPPMSSSVSEAYNRQISELEWRLMVTADTEVDALNA